MLLTCLLTTNFILFAPAAPKSIPLKDQLKEIITFINKEYAQETPLFDPASKPRVELMQAILDTILAKKTDTDWQDQDVTTPDDIKKSTDQINAFQEKLKNLYKSNPALFFSDADVQSKEAKNIPAPLVNAQPVPASDQLPDDLSFDYGDQWDTANMQPESSESYPQESSDFNTQDQNFWYENQNPAAINSTFEEPVYDDAQNYDQMPQEQDQDISYDLDAIER